MERVVSVVGYTAIEPLGCLDNRDFLFKSRGLFQDGIGEDEVSPFDVLFSRIQTCVLYHGHWEPGRSDFQQPLCGKGGESGQMV